MSCTALERGLYAIASRTIKGVHKFNVEQQHSQASKLLKAVFDNQTGAMPWLQGTFEGPTVLNNGYHSLQLCCGWISKT